MIRQPVRLALLVGAIVAAANSPARAQDKVKEVPPPATHTGPGCGPAMRTIQVTECVPETYKVKRIVHRVECRTEEYDAVKCVMEPQERTREVCEVKCVPTVTTERRKVCKNVTVCEERTVCKKEWRTVTETCMKKRLVRLGHWECCEVEVHSLFHRCRSSCDPCAPQCCPQTRTRKKWVHCPEYEYCPQTVCKKVCVEVPTVCRVPVCRQVWEEVDVQVCRYNRVESKRTVTETVCVPKQVAYKATRTVRVCVPHEEEVTCCRMVPRVVERQVPVVECAPACAPSCDDCCTSRRSHFGRLRGGHGHGHSRGGDCCH